MGVAFEMVCTALHLSDRGDRVNEIIAKRVIKFAKTGERNPIFCARRLERISRP
jgi:hypothetical protein